MNLLTPTPELLVKIGSLIVHYQEYRDDPHEFDLAAIKTLEEDPAVVLWLENMTRSGFLPLKRK